MARTKQSGYLVGQSDGGLDVLGAISVDQKSHMVRGAVAGGAVAVVWSMLFGRRHPGLVGALVRMLAGAGIGAGAGYGVARARGK